MAILDLKGLVISNSDRISFTEYIFNRLDDKEVTKIKCPNCGATKIKNKDCEYCGT